MNTSLSMLGSIKPPSFESSIIIDDLSINKGDKKKSKKFMSCKTNFLGSEDKKKKFAIIGILKKNSLFTHDFDNGEQSASRSDSRRSNQRSVKFNQRVKLYKYRIVKGNKGK